MRVGWWLVAMALAVTGNAEAQKAARSKPVDDLFIAERVRDLEQRVDELEYIKDRIHDLSSQLSELRKQDSGDRSAELVERMDKVDGGGRPWSTGKLADVQRELEKLQFDVSELQRRLYSIELDRDLKKMNSREP